MKLILKITAGVVLAIVLLTAGCAALIGSASKSVSKSIAVHNPPASAATSDPTSSGDVSRDNAVKSAEDYLDGQAFSRTGLIHQLTFEGYSKADAVYAVDNISPDWNAQAAKSAHDYLDGQAFSRSGLIHQLTFEGYTLSQATYGVNQTGL